MKTKIGIGLAALGRPEYINVRDVKLENKSENAFKENTFNVLDFAYKNGVRYFDTAPSYGLGEQFLIDWNNARQYKDVILGTKWGYTYVANWELGFSGKHEIKEHSVEKLIEQWKTSKLLLPQLEIYQIHSATLDSGVLKNTSVLAELFRLKKETGVQIGISSSGENQNEIIEEALKVKIDGECLFDSFQITYNIFDQSTFDCLEILKSAGKTIIIKEGLANGRVFNKQSASFLVLQKLANKYSVGVDAVCLRFIIDTVEPSYVLSGASSVDQLKANLKATNFSLTSEELSELKSLQISASDYWNERSRLDWN